MKARKNGNLIKKLFKRYSNVEEYHSSICYEFRNEEFPQIPPKGILMNSKTEVIERRRINFELFLQTIMIGGGQSDDSKNNFLSYFKTRSFFKLDYNFAKDNRTEKIDIHFCNNKCLEVRVSQDTSAGDILALVQKSWDIRDMNDYRLAFVHNRYGEKLLEADECPLQTIENINASGYMTNWYGKKVTKKMNSDILEFFKAKDSIFYMKKVIFRPDDFNLEFRMNEDEIRLRLYQAVFDLRVENILLDASEYVHFAGIRALIL